MERFSRHVYGLAWHTLGPVLRLFFRPRYRGRENIPSCGPVILSANHLSHIDPIFIMAATRRQVYYLSKQEHFEGTFRGMFLPRLGVVPVDREAGGAEALAKLEAILRRGGVVGLFPEGTRSRDGRRGRGKTGVARLAAATGAAVVPVAIRNTHRIMPVGDSRPRLWHRPDYEFGEPMHYPANSPADYQGLRHFTDRVMARIAILAGVNRSHRRQRQLRRRAGYWKERQVARLRSNEGRRRVSAWQQRQSARMRRNYRRNIATRQRFREAISERRAALRDRLGR